MPSTPSITGNSAPGTTSGKRSSGITSSSASWIHGFHTRIREREFYRPATNENVIRQPALCLAGALKPVVSAADFTSQSAAVSCVTIKDVARIVLLGGGRH